MWITDVVIFHQIEALPSFWRDSKWHFNLFLMMPVEALRSESFEDPGIIRPFLSGLHFSKISVDMSFHIWVDTKKKFCLVVFSFTRGTSSLSFSVFGRNESRLRIEIGVLNLRILNVFMKRWYLYRFWTFEQGFCWLKGKVFLGIVIFCSSGTSTCFIKVLVITV